MAIAKPPFSNIETSFGMSPIVAISIDGNAQPAGQLFDDGALVGGRMGDIEIIGLRQSGGDFAAERLVDVFGTALDTLVIVADADDLDRVIDKVVKIGDDLRGELHRLLLPRDMRGAVFVNQPIVAGIEPDVEPLVGDHLDDRPRDIAGQLALLDHR